MAKKKLNLPKVEIMRGRKYFVKRDNKGRFELIRKVAGSGLKLSDIKQLYKERRTFRRDKKITKLTHLKEIVIEKPTSISNMDKKIITPKPVSKLKIVQYYVSGYYKNEYIIARSQKIGREFAKTSSMAKKAAWNNFLMLVSQAINHKYDADDGLKEIKKITNLKEGWVYYESIKKD